MLFDPIVLLYISLFAGTLLFIEGIYYFVVDWRTGAGSGINKRLRLSEQSDNPKAVLRKMRREDQDAVSRMLARVFPALENLAWQSGSNISLLRLFVIMGALFAVLLSGLRLGTQVPYFIIIPASGLFAIAAPILLLMVRRRKRLKMFATQLPEALDLIVRSVRAGHPISASFSLVAKEMPDPIGSEFGMMLDEMTYGLDIHEALHNLYTRVPLTDLHFFTMAVQIQYGTGGNLAEVLSNLSNVIRERFRMFAKIRTVSAEGRMSAVVISLMPAFVILVVNIISPSYFGAVYHDSLFWPLMGLAALLLVTGVVWIWKMVNFRF